MKRVLLLALVASQLYGAASSVGPYSEQEMRSQYAAFAKNDYVREFMQDEAAMQRLEASASAYPERYSNHTLEIP